MAWYLDGAWEGLRVDRWVHLLAQMMFSVNERQAFLGRTLSTWDGLGSYPEAWQLDGLPRGFGEPAETKSYDDYLELLQESIADLYDVEQESRFVQQDGTDWTEASLFAAAQSPDHWFSLAWPSGLLPYLQLRAVIEQLIYLRCAMPSGSSSTIYTFLRNGSVNGNPQDAWAATLAATPYPMSPVNEKWRSLEYTSLSINGFVVGPTGYWQIIIPGISDETIKIAAVLRDSHLGGPYGWQDPIDILIGGIAYVAAAAPGNPATPVDQLIELGCELTSTNEAGAGVYRADFMVNVPVAFPFYPRIGSVVNNARYVRLLWNTGNERIIRALIASRHFTYG